MCSESKEMPRYKCHKEVHALKIKAINPPMSCGNAGTVRFLEWEDSQYAPIQVPEDWIRRHNPEPGGYFVRYEDGYTSYSPAEAFEKGYTRIDPLAAAPSRRYTGAEVTVQIANNFTYHAPKDHQAERYILLRERAMDLADMYATCCPPSRELSLALTKLEEASMWANAAIARNE